MRQSHRLGLPFLLTSLLAAQDPAANAAPTKPPTTPALALPAGTGHLSPAADWVVLTGEVLARHTRPDDPTAAAARARFADLVGRLQKDQRTAEHVVCHQPGATAAQVRIVDAYADKTPASSKEVLDAAESVRAAVQPSLEAPGVTVTYRGSADARLFAIGSLVLHFELAQDDAHWLVDYHVVPAGDHVQYFEALRFADDEGGAAAIETLLRSFDGAKEAGFDPILRNMLIGGLLGGALGVFMARRRQRLRQRAQADNS